MRRRKNKTERPEPVDGEEASVEEVVTPARRFSRVVTSLIVAVLAIGAYFVWQGRSVRQAGGDAAAMTGEDSVNGGAVENGPANSDAAAIVPAASAVAARRASVALTAPPEIDTQGVDREVVQALERDRATVLKNPESARAWGLLGMTCFAHEFNTVAAACFEQAARLDAADPRWPYLHGRVLRMTSPEESIERLTTAAAIPAAQPPAVRLTLCEVLLESYRLEEAEQYLRAYLKETPNDPRARLAEARLLAMRGDYASCLERLTVLRRDLDTQPRFNGRKQSILLLLAEAQRRQGQVEQAETTRRQANNESDPSWPDPYFEEVGERRVGLKKYLSDADRLYTRRQYAESQAMLEATVTRYPESIWGKILLARVLIRTGAPDSPAPDRQQRLERAIRLLDETLAIDANSVEAMFRLAVAKGYQGDLQAAVALYRRAIELKPDFTMAYYNLAGILWNQLGDVEGANAAFEGAIQSQPDFVDGHFLYGVVLMRQGRFADAVPHFETVVRLQPAKAQYQAALAEAQRRAQAGAPDSGSAAE